MNELHLFAGAGGGILGGILLGHTCVCAVEIEPYCQKVLLQRQRDGILPKFPIWDDVRTFDGRPWRGKVDVVCGGFPCQDISIAGKGKGIDGERSGLWREMVRVVREVGPNQVLVENTSALLTRGMGVVLRDLAQMGYNARWGVFSAKEINCIHLRERIFILASNNSNDLKKRMERLFQKKVSRQQGFPWRESIRKLEDLFNRPDIPTPLFRRMDDVVADYVDRISAIGNGQVPAVVKLAWETLTS